MTERYGLATVVQDKAERDIINTCIRERQAATVEKNEFNVRCSRIYDIRCYHQYRRQLCGIEVRLGRMNPAQAGHFAENVPN